MHITNFNERFNGRLHYNTGRRINNGFIRLGNSVLEFSDRDIQKYYKNYKDLSGAKALNDKLKKTCYNYKPDLIILGHADLISADQISQLREDYPNTRFSQWFLDPLNKNGWEEKNFDISILLDGNERKIETHKIDCFKNKIGIEIEWNNKTEFYDRDSLGRTIPVNTKTNKWTIVEKRPYYYEEKFTVFGSRKRFETKDILKQILLPSIKREGVVKQVNYVLNKLMIWFDGDFDVILCKCEDDARDLHNVLRDFCETQKISNVIFSGLSLIHI